MNDISHRYPLNTPGKYYVTGMCTDCDACLQHAPRNVRRDDRTGNSYVFRQPSTPEEVRLLKDGAASCPTEAVRTDGDKFDWIHSPVFDWNALYADKGIEFAISAPVAAPPSSRTKEP